MWEKEKNYFYYANLTREQFYKVLPQVESENASALKIATLVQMLYFGFSFLAGMRLTEMSDKQLVYAIGTLIPFLLMFLQRTLGKQTPSAVPILVRCFCASVLLTGLLCTLVCTPDEMTILLLIFFFCVPMLFITRPIEWVTLVFLTDVLYFAIAPQVKSPDVLLIDMIDVGIFSTLSIILGVTHLIRGFRRYWLETNAVDLAEVRYQAAFLDQLTGILNRNAYNRDTEHADTSALPADFLYLALDINGLKASNDSLGHVAGDELIVGAAACLKKSFADYGKVYRVGGDEFIAMLYTGGRSEGELLSSFNRTVSEWHGFLNSSLSVSYGVVLGSEVSGLSFHELELLADKRMYQSKSDHYKNPAVDRRKRSAAET